MHIVLHALSLLVVAPCVTNEHDLSVVQVKRPEQNTAFNA